MYLQNRNKFLKIGLVVEDIWSFQLYVFKDDTNIRPEIVMEAKLGIIGQL